LLASFLIIVHKSDSKIIDTYNDMYWQV